MAVAVELPRIAVKNPCRSLGPRVLQPIKQNGGAKPTDRMAYHGIMDITKILWISWDIIYNISILYIYIYMYIYIYIIYTRHRYPTNFQQYYWFGYGSNIGQNPKSPVSLGLNLWTAYWMLRGFVGLCQDFSWTPDVNGMSPTCHWFHPQV